MVCPLDWGLGHATRVVPIVQKLVNLDCDVVLGISGSSGNFLKDEFPELRTINIPSYTIRYSRKNSQVMSILFQIPGLLYYSFLEHQKLKKLLSREKFYLVLSDQRFGLWSKNVYTVFLTHQLNVKFPFKVKVFENFFNFLQHKIIQRFDECWVPDFKDSLNLSGELSDKPGNLKHVYYTGTLARFQKNESRSSREKQNKELLILLSGPEPQRSMLEEILESQVDKIEMNVTFVRGIKAHEKKSDTQNTTYYNLLNSRELGSLLSVSEIVVCRSGYSTLMELVSLGKKALLIPTPGQTEQEYLARYLYSKGYYYSVHQGDVNLGNDLKIAENYSPPVYPQQSVLDDMLESVVKKIKA